MSITPESQPFVDSAVDPAVRGFIHRPAVASEYGLVLTHGAGSNSQTALLISLAQALSQAGFAVLRCDLPFRQIKHFGPPRPGDAARDREGLKNAVAALREEVAGRIFLGGHSYGGRQATMLAADAPELIDCLLVLSYPLHPPRKAEQLRTQHFPGLKTPCMFVHGSRDPFGSIEEMESALALIRTKHLLIPVPRAGHDLGFKKKDGNDALLHEIVDRFQNFIS